MPKKKYLNEINRNNKQTKSKELFFVGKEEINEINRNNKQTKSRDFFLWFSILE
jgi:hypothetical protein